MSDPSQDLTFTFNFTFTLPRGLLVLKHHVLTHKIEAAMWCTRLATIIFTLGYILPIMGNPYNSYYKALMANGATSALRLHQRLPQVQFDRQFLTLFIMDDSSHYLFFSIIFIFTAPITLVLAPVALFAVLHFVSYSLTLLDMLGTTFRTNTVETVPTRMSWQDVVNTQLIGKDLTKAAICGHDGNLLAKSENFNVTAGELQAILQKYDNRSQLAASGFVLGGQKYFYISGYDEVIRGKQTKLRGVHLVKTNQTLLVGVYEDPMNPARAATVTEKLGDYLKGVGY